MPVKPDDDYIHDAEDKFRALRRLRRRAGWTQQQVTDAIGVCKSAVCQWERGASYPDFKSFVILLRIIDNWQMTD